MLSMCIYATAIFLNKTNSHIKISLWYLLKSTFSIKRFFLTWQHKLKIVARCVYLYGALVSYVLPAFCLLDALCGLHLQVCSNNRIFMWTTHSSVGRKIKTAEKYHILDTSKFRWLILQFLSSCSSCSDCISNLHFSTPIWKVKIKENILFIVINLRSVTITTSSIMFIAGFENYSEKLFAVQDRYSSLNWNH